MWRYRFGATIRVARAQAATDFISSICGRLRPVDERRTGQLILLRRPFDFLQADAFCLSRCRLVADRDPPASKEAHVDAQI